MLDMYEQLASDFDDEKTERLEERKLHKADAVFKTNSARNLQTYEETDAEKTRNLVFAIYDELLESEEFG